MKLTTLIVLFLIVIKPATAQTNVRLISPNELELKLQDSILLFDVRMKIEFDQWHIQSAKNVNLFSKNFEQQFVNLDKSESIYLYCRSGHRSIKAGQKLLEIGFLNVYSLEKGTNGWKRAKKPLIY